MRTYTRAQIEGGCYFFTVNLATRGDNDLLVRRVDLLREAFRRTRNDHPFDIDAIVILPEHLIRNQRDWQQHVDYIHFNPVKHGHVARAIDWPHSSIHRFIRNGLCDPTWAANDDVVKLDHE